MRPAKRRAGRAVRKSRRPIMIVTDRAVFIAPGASKHKPTATEWPVGWVDLGSTEGS